MQVIEVDPKKCVRWKLADRSGFEFGDIFALSQDITKNGQIEPVILRKSSDPKYQYEVIAGSRRWKACLEANIPLKGIVQNLSDEQASISQIKENQQLPICDYSKGISYSKLLKETKMTRADLAASIGCSRQKLENFLTFDKIPSSIWDAVGNLSKVSSKTAAFIYRFTKKGKPYVDAIINMADDIKKGSGERTLEQKALKFIKGNDHTIDSHKKIELPSGRVIAEWTKNGIQFSKDIPFNPKAIEAVLVKYFQKALR